MAIRSRAFTFPLILLIVTSLTFSTAGCKKKSKSSGKKQIVILTNGSSPFWDAAVRGAKDAADELNLGDEGYSIEVHRGDFTVPTQLSLIKRYATSTDVKAVAISVVDSKNEAIAEEIKKLRDSGVKVITIDSDVDRDLHRDARFAYLGTDNIVAGRELGIAVKELREKPGNYATFVGRKGASNAQERIRGFGEGAGDGYTQVENLEDGGDEKVARDRVKEALNRSEEKDIPLDILVGIWSYNAPAIVDTVTQQNKRDQFTIAAFDADPPTIEGMNEGNVDVMLVQNPYQMGFKGVKLLKAMLEDDEEGIKEILPDVDATDGDLHNTGLKVVVPNGESKLKKEMFLKTTQFMTLEEFEEWLKKYELTGS